MITDAAASIEYKKRTAFILRAVLLVFMACSLNVYSQDTTLVITKDGVLTDTSTITSHSAHKATIYSLVLPGLGQAYNKKYWKIPVIYAGFGYLGYSIKINRDEMLKFTAAYRFIANDEPGEPVNEYVTKYPNTSDLLRGRDFYRRKVELNIIYSAVWYILNLVDAAVDAHFFDYDISDDLALRIKPAIIPAQNNLLPHSNGISLCLTLK
jgi:hypothetical protein